MLVTSRAVLRLRGEHEFRSRHWASPTLDAARSRRNWHRTRPSLFSQRATIFRPGFSLTAENALAVSDICRRLDGLPLAIELAAARVKLLAPQAMLGRLERRLPLLTGGARDLPERQRSATRSPGATTCSTSLNVSSSAASPSSSEGCTVEAAEAIGAEDGEPGLDVFDGIASLVDKSLLRQHDGPDGEPRYDARDDPRVRLEQLEAADEERAVADISTGSPTSRNAASPGVFGPEGYGRPDGSGARQLPLGDGLEHDRSSGSVRAGLRIAGALQQVWLWRDGLAEGQRWYEQTLAADEAQNPTKSLETTLPAARLGAHGVHPRVIALNGPRVLRRSQRRLTEQDPAGEALALARAVQDRRGEAQALLSLGVVALDRESSRPRPRSLYEGLSVTSGLGDLFGLWRSHQLLGTPVARGRVCLRIPGRCRKSAWW